MGSLKNNFTFYTPMHPLRLRCESSQYPDISAFSRPRLSGMTHLSLKIVVCFCRKSAATPKTVN
jgi:hypothetical protein